MPVAKREREPEPPNPAPRADELPAIATVFRFLARRPLGQAFEPFEIPGDLFDAARDELQANMKKRGFPLPVSHDCRFENFMLMGHVIVKGE